MGMKTVEKVSHDRCTGCCACYNICPKAAISMKEDRDGFLYPEIDKNLCIDCGKCLAICPALHLNYENDIEPECYAAMAEDEIRKASSSGGMFSLLADHFIEQEGVVYGAAYTENYHNVEHVSAETQEELVPLRGSKYVQSYIGDSFTQVKEQLATGRKVLFTGTPCQVAGLKAYLGRDYEGLYIVDLVCHGTPPVKLYRKFIEEIEAEQGRKVTYVSFRDKETGGWNPSTFIKLEGGRVIQKKRNDSPYLNAFLQLLTLRECCGNCKFATLPRQGDLTLADFWDVHRYDPALDDRKGTSAVLVNNEKGEELLGIIKEKSIKVAKVPLSHAVRYNPQIKYSSIHHKHRERFFELLREYPIGMEKAVNDALHRHFDIGYIGWWYGDNYGSVITSFAMNRILKGLGKTVLMIDFPYLPGKSSKKWESAARRFANHFYETSMRRQVDKHGDLNYYCDSFLVGSDQLWNWWSNNDVGSYYYFLDFADKKHKKIAYATSFGHASGYYPEDMRVKVSYLLHRFDAISVREASGVDICAKNFGVDAVQVLDPVFLCSREDYNEAISLSNIQIEEPYVLAYILNPTEDKIKTVRRAAAEKGMPYHIIIDGQGNQEELLKAVNDPNVLPKMEIADWLKYFAHASYVVTDSYHGFCFSIIFGKQMVVYPNALRGATRFEALGNITGLYSRFVQSHSEVLEKKLFGEDVDFEEVHSRLEPELQKSRQWLKDALDSKSKAESAETIGLWKILEYDAEIHRMKREIKELRDRLGQ